MTQTNWTSDKHGQTHLTMYRIPIYHAIIVFFFSPAHKPLIFKNNNKSTTIEKCIATPLFENCILTCYIGRSKYKLHK